MVLVLRLAGAGVEDTRARRQGASELRDRVFDLRLEVQDISTNGGRQEVAQPVVNHDFLRASTMMVDPARQAASSSVKGTELATSVR